MKKVYRVGNCFVLLLAVITIAGCKNPIAPDDQQPETRMLELYLEGNRPFYFEGSFDNFNQKFVVDSSHFNSYRNVFVFLNYSSVAKGSSFRIYAKSQSPDGYVLAQVRMYTGASEFNNYQAWFQDNRQGEVIDISCIVP
jgi:hypothetical protein